MTVNLKCKDNIEFYFYEKIERSVKYIYVQLYCHADVYDAESICPLMAFILLYD